MIDEYKKTFNNDPKAPKPKFLDAGRLLKIKKEQGQNVFENALGQLIAADQNVYHGYSNQARGTNAANKANSAVIAPLPVAAPTATPPAAAMSPSLFRSSQTRRRMIRSLEEVLDALRAEEGAPPSARSPRPVLTQKRAAAKSKAKTVRMAAPASRSPGAGPAGPPTGQQAIARARASLTRKAGVKISQKIAAPFAAWAKGKPREEVSAKKAEVAAALQARAGRNNNAIAVNTGLKSRENIDRRRQELERIKARKAAAAAGQ
jgi:hypothetical protein